MNDLFSKIDSIDLSSILTEDETVVQEQLNEQFSGQWESNEVVSEKDQLLESILKEVSDNLAITNIKLTKRIVEMSLDTVYPRWPKKLYEAVLEKLEEAGFDISKLKEDKIEDIQKEISDLNQADEALDKTGKTSTEVDNKKVSRKDIKYKVSDLKGKLNKEVKDKNDNLDNGFGDEKLTEDTSGIDLALDPLEEIMQVIENEGSIDQNLMLDRVKLAISYLDKDEKYANIVSMLQEIINIVDDEGSIDQDIMLSKVSDAEDALTKLVLGSKDSMNESIAANVTVDNVDQESKDKATIDKALELAGDKTTIDNDTFRELKTQLDGNKDYSMVDRTSDYALVRGEDVIYTWSRKEDENLKESNILKERKSYNLEAIKQEYDKLLPTVDQYREGEDDNIGLCISVYDGIPGEDNTYLEKTYPDFDFFASEFDKYKDGDFYAYFEIYELDNLEDGYVDGLNYCLIESVHVNVSGGNVDVSTDNTNVAVDGDNVDVHVDENTAEVEIPEPEDLEPAGSDVSAEEIIDEPADEVLDEPENTDEEILSDPEEIINDDAIVDATPNGEQIMGYEEADGSLQVDNVPGKVDHKRIELAKLESEDKVSYRVSYLNEDDEVCGWDLDCDSDEDAINSLDQFQNAGQITDDLMSAEFVETGIDGVSSLNYNNTNILLSTDGENNIITVNQDNSEPVVMKGESFDDVLNQLIYWFIVNTPDAGETANELDTEPVENTEKISEPEIDELNSKEDSDE